MGKGTTNVAAAIFDAAPVAASTVPTNETAEQTIARLTAELAAAKAAKPKFDGTVTMAIGDGHMSKDGKTATKVGNVLFYGFGVRPLSFWPNQLEKLIGIVTDQTDIGVKGIDGKFKFSEVYAAAKKAGKLSYKTTDAE